MVEKPIPPVVFSVNDVIDSPNNSDAINSSESVNHAQDDLDSTWFDSGTSNNLETEHVYVNDHQQAGPSSGNSNESAQPNIKLEILANDRGLMAFDNIFNDDSSAIDPFGSIEFESTRNDNVNNEEIPDEAHVNVGDESNRANDDEPGAALPEEGAHENNNGDELNSAFVQNNEDSDNDDGEENERERQIKENLEKVLKFGRTVIVDTDCQYIHMPDEVWKTIEPQFEVKSNDVLCGNVPFKEIVCV